MRETITPVTPRDANLYPNLVVQAHAEHQLVGIGLEPQREVPGLHFIDAIYGEAPTQTEIGRILWPRLQEQRAIFGRVHAEFKDSDDEAEFYNELGRACLDAVTGSTADDSMWSWFDRAGVNRFIRLLRKGRDLAFGRDE